MTFNPARLSLARHSLGWTKTRLANEVGITTRRLADYENRGDVPPAATLSSLARALRMNEGYFLGDDPAEPTDLSFRSLRSMPARVRNMATATASMTVEVGDWISERFDLEPVSLREDLAGSDPALAASALREQWGLGLQPAPNLIQLAELMGVRVFALSVNARTLDAFSFWDESTPYVLLNARGTAERRRWDMAHEIGHLLLHAGSNYSSSEGRREEEADAFAAALLLPLEGLRKHRARATGLEEIRKLKVFWRVSALALMRQMYKHGQLTEWQYRNLAIEASKANLRRFEDDIPFETSPVLSQTLQVLRTRGFGPTTIAQELRLRSADVRNMFHALAPLDLGGEGTATRPSPSGRHLRAVK